MARRGKSSGEIASTDWHWSTDDDQFTRDQIVAASTHALYQELRITNALLRAIIVRLDGLGKDGLHTVIRHYRREVAARNAEARAAAKARRQQS